MRKFRIRVLVGEKEMRVGLRDVFEVILNVGMERG